MLQGGGYKKLDLLIGGSPCQDLSRAKHGRMGLKGERSGLFYEYYRILQEARPRYFVLENVASMPAESREEITRFLRVEPIMIDAALVSAQSRRRLFWTNIPGITQPKDRGIFLKDILEDGIPGGTGIIPPTLNPKRLGDLEGYKGAQSGRVYSAHAKSTTLQALAGGGGAKTGLYWILPDGRLMVREATKLGYAIAEEGDSVDVSFPASTTRRGRVGKKAKNLMTSSHISVFTKGEVRPLTAVECERLQSLPDGYTEGLSTPQRIKTLGNAFNVEVVRHILSHTDL